jgi:hypothetical protein
MFVGVGIVISYFFDYGMRYVGGPVAWVRNLRAMTPLWNLC